MGCEEADGDLRFRTPTGEHRKLRRAETGFGVRIVSSHPGDGLHPVCRRNLRRGQRADHAGRAWFRPHHRDQRGRVQQHASQPQRSASHFAVARRSAMNSSEASGSPGCQGRAAACALRIASSRVRPCSCPPCTSSSSSPPFSMPSDRRISSGRTSRPSASPRHPHAAHRLAPAASPWNVAIPRARFHYARSTAPVALVTAATTLALAASISASVSVRSRG